MKNQPKIEIPVSSMEKMLDAAAILFSGLALLTAMLQYDGLPAQIPSHFNASGAVDSFSNKNTILILPVLAIVMAIGMIFLTQFPHKFNYLNKITPDNAAYEYKKSRFMLRGVNMLVSLLFLVITWAIIEASQGASAQQLGILFWFVLIAILIGPVIFYWVWPKQEK